MGPPTLGRTVAAGMGSFDEAKDTPLGVRSECLSDSEGLVQAWVVDRRNINNVVCKKHPSPVRVADWVASAGCLLRRLEEQVVLSSRRIMLPLCTLKWYLKLVTTLLHDDVVQEPFCCVMQNPRRHHHGSSLVFTHSTVAAFVVLPIL